ncbi:MAG: aminoglycoside phosphotransferase family protein [Saprospiraceae bacterium]|jgi:hypothetical protein|nr:aminoglycoside phosphotransferase family protein [Saprospiraceae bacterium]
MQEDLREIAARFLPVSPGELNVLPIESGLINRTFLVQTRAGERYVLQRVNHHVFPNPDAIAANVEHVNARLAESGYPLERVHFFKTQTGAYHHYDPEGWPWRLVSHVPDSATYDKARTPERAREGARAFSLFYRHLNVGSGSLPLTPAIPDFINFRKRIADYRAALQERRNYATQNSKPNTQNWLPERRKRAAALIALVQPHLDLPEKWIEWQEAGLFPMRVIHADPKISNVLFHETRHTARAVIDLDTVMPGTLLYDFGDMARSYANTTAEDDASEPAPFSPELYRATREGFLSQLSDVLEPIELENLDYSAQVVVLIQCLRFLTDYLQGDVYYRVVRQEQNLERAVNQFRLLGGMRASSILWHKKSGAQTPG